MKINVIWVIFNIKKFMKLEINSIIDKGEYKGKKFLKYFQMIKSVYLD